ISNQSVRSWAPTTQKSPSALSTVCPHCGERVTFSLSRHHEDKFRSAVSGSSGCPNCQVVVHFWAVHNNRGSGGEPDAIYMYPPVRSFFQASSLSSEVPEPLKKSFVSTVDAFNSRNFVATSVCCRRTLEGIIKYLLPEDKRKGNLIKLIDLAATTLDLAAPLRSLSHAIRDGGNLGAHFDEEKEPTEDLARQMVELLDYLIAYLYVLPGQISELENSLGKEA
ncbi:MAG: DUF4145 domain-containing protein, partial [Pseudomonadales bacterium]